MAEPLVSIIMNCLDGEKYLKRAIDSIYCQTYSNWEIIFLDNCSIDSSSLIAKSYDDKIKIFSLDKTIELGDARNLAIKKANGEFLAFLDVDDQWLPNKIKLQVNLFNNRDVGMVFSDTKVIDGNKSSKVFDFMIPSNGQISSQLIRQNFITTSSLIYRKSVLDKLPFVFRDNFLLLVDYDLSIRISTLCLADFVDEPLTIVYKHEDNASLKNKDRYFKESKIFIEYLLNKQNKLSETYSESISYFLDHHNVYLAELEFESGNIDNAKKIIMASANKSMQNIILYALVSFLPNYKIYLIIKKLSRKIFHFFRKIVN
jgi:glycosyltransferase involved in cell wall biosynthesis